MCRFANLLGEGLLLPLLHSSADKTRLPPPSISSLSRKRESCDPEAAACWLGRCAGGDGEGDEAAVVELGERLLVILNGRQIVPVSPVIRSTVLAKEN